MQNTKRKRVALAELFMDRSKAEGTSFRPHLSLSRPLSLFYVLSCNFFSPLVSHVRQHRYLYRCQLLSLSLSLTHSLTNSLLSVSCKRHPLPHRICAEESVSQKADDSFAKRLSTQVINNLQIFVDIVHIRYEDPRANPLVDYS